MIGADVRALLAASRDPIPAVHPSWLPVIPVSDDPRVAVWLARTACAQLPPLPRVREGDPRIDADIVALADPLPFLSGRGRDLLAFATGLRTGLLANARVTPGMTDRRAAIAKCAGVQLDELGLIRVGARTLTLSRLQQQQLLVKLPREIAAQIANDLAASPTPAP